MSQAIRESLLQHDTQICGSSQVLLRKGIVLHALQRWIANKSSIDETLMLAVLNLMVLDVYYPYLLFWIFRNRTDRQSIAYPIREYALPSPFIRPTPNVDTSVRFPYRTTKASLPRLS